jgi:hypothetical protein
MDGWKMFGTLNQVKDCVCVCVCGHSYFSSVFIGASLRVDTLRIPKQLHMQDLFFFVRYSSSNLTKQTCLHEIRWSNNRVFAGLQAECNTIPWLSPLTNSLSYSSQTVGSAVYSDSDTNNAQFKSADRATRVTLVTLRSVWASRFSGNSNAQIETADIVTRVTLRLRQQI